MCIRTREGPRRPPRQPGCLGLSAMLPMPLRVHGVSWRPSFVPSSDPPITCIWSLNSRAVAVATTHLSTFSLLLVHFVLKPTTPKASGPHSLPRPHIATDSFRVTLYLKQQACFRSGLLCRVFQRREVWPGVTAQVSFFLTLVASHIRFPSKCFLEFKSGQMLGQVSGRVSFYSLLSILVLLSSAVVWACPTCRH